MRLIIDARQIAALIFVPGLLGWGVGIMTGAFITGYVGGLFFVAAMAGVVAIVRAESKRVASVMAEVHDRAMANLHTFKRQIESEKDHNS